MSNETDIQEAHDADSLRASPTCTRCGRRHPRSARPCAFWYPTQHKPTPPTNIIIEISGGLVSRVLSERPVHVTVVDCDIEGNGQEDPTEDVYRIAPSTMGDGQYDLAMVSWPEAEVNPAVVAAYLARIKRSGQ